MKTNEIRKNESLIAVLLLAFWPFLFSLCDGYYSKKAPLIYYSSNVLKIMLGKMCCLGSNRSKSELFSENVFLLSIYVFLPLVYTNIFASFLQNVQKGGAGFTTTIYKDFIKKLQLFCYQWQKLWEKLLFGQFHVSTHFPLLTMLRNNKLNLRQAMLWVRNIV